MAGRGLDKSRYSRYGKDSGRRRYSRYSQIADFKANVIPVIAVQGGGTPFSGAILEITTPPSWSYPPDTETNQWEADSAALAGVTTPTHTLVAGNVGKSFALRKNATYGAKKATALSNEIVQAAEFAATAAPVIAVQGGGSPIAGATLTVATEPTWNYAPSSETYQWLNNGAAIAGATAATYVIPTASAGMSFTMQKTGNFETKTATTTSNAIVGA